MAILYEGIKDIPVREGIELEGELIIEEDSSGIVIFSHGSGSSRKSPRNNFVAKILRDKGVSTLLFDLLTPKEDMNYNNRFDIPLLTNRLIDVTEWLKHNDLTAELIFGYFGASTGAASALKAAAHFGNEIKALVSRGGRVDMAEDVLEEVETPCLFIVGGKDVQVRKWNKNAYDKLINCKKQYEVITGAGHLFSEPGKLEQVAELASNWFKSHLEKK